MNKRLASSLFFLFTLSLSTLAFAAPSISSISGSVGEGSAVIIKGQGFLDFGGDIVSWDSFEDKRLGDRINGSEDENGATWTTYGSYSGLGAVFDGERSRSGNVAAHLDWSIDSNTIRAFGWAGRGPYNKLYISYWRSMSGDYMEALSRYNAGTANAPNHKQFYLYGNSSQFPQFMPIIQAGGDKVGIYNNISTSNRHLSWGEKYNSGWNWGNTSGRWDRWEFNLKLNSAGSQDGVAQVWKNGDLGFDLNNYEHRTNNGEWIDWRLGHMAQRFSGSAKAWFDDVYVATTQARVEICDSELWSQCSNKDIQKVIPAEWSSNSIRVNLRKGGQDSFNGKYIFVINKEGEVNSVGYPLEVDFPLIENSPPKAPTGFIIK